MTNRRPPNVFIEKISLDRIKDIHEVVVESGKDWFANGMLPKPELSIDELRQVTMNFIEEWENNTSYMFIIVDASSNQGVGFAVLNHINRQHQTANLGYQVRTSRLGEGIATEAAKQVAMYGFEKFGFQRIEILVARENIPSQKVAEKLGAIREGLLRRRLQINGSAHDAYMYSLIPNDFGIHNTA